MYHRQQKKCYLIAKVLINLPISKLHSILAVANLLAHNNISQICYCGQISLQSAAVILTIWLFGVTFIFLLVMVLIQEFHVLRLQAELIKLLALKLATDGHWATRS